MGVIKLDKIGTTMSYNVGDFCSDVGNKETQDATTIIGTETKRSCDEPRCAAGGKAL